MSYGRIIKEFRGKVIVERWFGEGVDYINVESGWWNELRFVKSLFDTYHYATAYLAKLLISDLRYLRSTHALKNRVIARLRKFARVVKLLGLEEYYLEEISKLKEIIRVLEAVKNEFHKVRDPVHELLYPHIVDVLESFMVARLRYYLKGRYHLRKGTYVEVRYELNKFTGEYRKEVCLVVDTSDMYSEVELSDDELDAILTKQEERRRRRARQAEYGHVSQFLGVSQ